MYYILNYLDKKNYLRVLNVDMYGFTECVLFSNFDLMDI